MTVREMRGIGGWACRVAHAKGGDRAVDRDSKLWFEAQRTLYPDLKWAPFIDAWWDEALELAGASDELMDVVRGPRRPY